MILSNSSLQMALAAGSIIIDPRPTPLRPVEGAECPYQTSAVDLRLGREFSQFKPGLGMAIDLSRGSFKPLFAANSESIELPDGGVYVLRRNQLVLARTAEVVGLPVGPKGPWYAARVEGKSSYARCGLLVHFTAPTIHCGFHGSITLELMNLGPFDINLRVGAPICQLVVEQLDKKPFVTVSQFQNQSRPGGAAK